MSMNKKEILYWCDSVENTWKPREDVPRGENPQLIPESFLATAIRYLRALCDHNEVASKAGDVCGKCVEKIDKNEVKVLWNDFHDNFESTFRNPDSLNYTQLAKDIFPVQTMPQGAIPFYLDHRFGEKKD